MTQSWHLEKYVGLRKRKGDQTWKDFEKKQRERESGRMQERGGSPCITFDVSSRALSIIPPTYKLKRRGDNTLPYGPPF